MGAGLVCAGLCEECGVSLSVPLQWWEERRLFVRVKHPRQLLYSTTIVLRNGYRNSCTNFCLRFSCANYVPRCRRPGSRTPAVFSLRPYISSVSSTSLNLEQERLFILGGFGRAQASQCAPVYFCSKHANASPFGFVLFFGWYARARPTFSSPTWRETWRPS